MTDPYASKPWLKFYDKHVPEKLTYPENKLITDLFRESVEKVKDKVAVYYAGKGTAFGELDALSSKFANFLIQQGLKQGDVIGVYMPNVLANYITGMGILKAGCVVSGVSPLLSHKELDFQLNNSGAKALVAIDVLWGNISPVISKTGIKTVVMVSVADFLPSFKKMLGKLLKKIPQIEVKPVAGVTMHNFMDIMKKMPATTPCIISGCRGNNRSSNRRKDFAEVQGCIDNKAPGCRSDISRSQGCVSGAFMTCLLLYRCPFVAEGDGAVEGECAIGGIGVMLSRIFGVAMLVISIKFILAK